MVIFFQKFYGARISLNPDSDVVDANGVILTENLKISGYSNVDRHLGFNLDQSKAVLRDLATFHATPIAIKLKNKPLFDEKIRPYLPGLKPGDPEANPIKHLSKQLISIPELAQYVDRIESNIKNNSDSLNKSVNEPWGSISHDDFWINNVMITNDPIPKVVILDFQCPVYGSITADLLFFLSTSVNLDIIRTNMDLLIQYYWDEFVKNLVELKIDTALFPHEEFLKELDEVAQRQFSHAAFHTFIIFAEKGTTALDSSKADFKKEEFEHNDMSLNSRHITKYIWLVEEYAKRNWI